MHATREYSGKYMVSHGPYGSMLHLEAGHETASSDRTNLLCPWMNKLYDIKRAAPKYPLEPKISLATNLLTHTTTPLQHSLTFALQQGQGCGSVRKKHLPWQRGQDVPPKPRVVPVLPNPSQTGHLVIGDGDSMISGDSYRSPTLHAPFVHRTPSPSASRCPSWSWQ